MLLKFAPALDHIARIINIVKHHDGFFAQRRQNHFKIFNRRFAAVMAIDEHQPKVFFSCGLLPGVLKARFDLK